MTRKEFRRLILTRPEKNCALEIGGHPIFVNAQNEMFVMYSQRGAQHSLLNWAGEVRRDGDRHLARGYLKTCRELRMGSYALAA